MQGKMETYRQQVDELSQRLSQLQAENDSLETRNRLLEKVVQMKDSKPQTVAVETVSNQHPLQDSAFSSTTCNAYGVTASPCQQLDHSFARANRQALRKLYAV